MKTFEEVEVLFLYIRHLGTKFQWVVSFIFQLLYRQKQSSMPIEDEAVWIPKPVWNWWFVRDV